MDIITGFHRSGTSAFAGACFMAGLPMGDKEKMLLGLSDNPKGHWEHTDYLGINDNLLNSNGGSWNEPKPILSISPPTHMTMRRLSSDDILVKDPRFCLTAKIWDELASVNDVFILLRNPLECIRSLEVRSPGTKFSTSLWLKYNEELLYWLIKEKKNPMVIEYDFLLSHPFIVADIVRRFLDIHPDHFNDHGFIEFIEKGLKHHDSNGKLPAECRDLYGQLLSLGEKTFEQISGKP